MDLRVLRRYFLLLVRIRPVHSPVDGLSDKTRRLAERLAKLAEEQDLANESLVHESHCILVPTSESDYQIECFNKILDGPLEVSYRSYPSF